MCVCPLTAGYGTLALIYGGIMYNRFLWTYGSYSSATLGACFYLTIIAVVLNSVMSSLLFRASILQMVPEAVVSAAGIVITANPIADQNASAQQQVCVCLCVCLCGYWTRVRLL